MDLNWEESFTSILILNDACLFHILSFLTLPELIVTEKVCDRFAVVVRQVYNSYRVLDLQCCEISQATEIASRVGRRIHTLRLAAHQLPDHFEPLLSGFVQKHFQSLQAIYLDNFYDFARMNKELVANLATTFQGVKEVEMKNYQPSDEYLQAMFNLEELEVLKLASNRGSSGSFLTGLKNIRVLSLEYCCYVEPQLFMLFCREHPNLQSLNISGCWWVDKVCFQSITANLKNLNHIMISDYYPPFCTKDYIALEDLPKLKHLQINLSYLVEGFNQHLEVILSRVSAYNRLEHLEFLYVPISAKMDKSLGNLTNLRELHFFRNDLKDSTLISLACKGTLQRLVIPKADVTPRGLEQLIARCPSLELLNVVECQEINGNFIPQILHHLKGRSHMLQLVVNEKIFPREEFRHFIGVNPTKLMLNYELEIAFE